MEENQLDELIEVAMKIIINAGDARQQCQAALKAAKQFDFAGAAEFMKEADALMLLAHQAQTGIIQNEAAGRSYGPSLLFNHAQDTLMTIKSELALARDMIEFFEIINNKIEKQ